jgi:hypothetical protein
VDERSEGEAKLVTLGLSCNTGMMDEEGQS